MKLASALSLSLMLALIVTVTAIHGNHDPLVGEKDYTDLVNFLKTQIESPTAGFKGKAYERLANISDTYGPRLWGSDTLQKVIGQVLRMANAEGFDNARLQPVGPFTKWVRGKESLVMTSPRPFPQKLDIIGLGRSPKGQVKAEAVVVRNWADLDALGAKVSGKIVVYNYQWTNYGDDVQYRANGGDRAAAYGAVGALVRSLASESIYSVHTGVQYGTKIPIGAITVEDAQMMARMQLRGQKIELQMSLQNQQIPNIYSNNVIFEIKGAEFADQILLMGGHIDSWDTGSQTGANDDGGGFITCFQAMRLLLKSGLRPKRTIRFIAWSGEEWGDPSNGNKAYLKAHMSQLSKHVVAFEDDLGSTKLLGFGFSGNASGMAVVKSVATKYLNILGAQQVSDNGEAVDTGPLLQNGVPTMINLIQDTPEHKFYFKYHHSAGDTMSMMNPDDLDSNVVGVAAMFFILADLEQTIPRGDNLRTAH